MHTPIEEALDSFQLDQPMAAGTRLRWARHQEKIENIVVRVRASKSSLNLILTIFTCASVSEIQSSISNLNTSVQSILANSEDIPRRIACIETKIAGLSRHATSTIERPTERSDGASTIRPTNCGIENGHLSPPGVGYIMSQFGIQTQKELEASRVYRRTAERHSTSSLLCGLHSAAWSTLSGVSLAEISCLSVLSLPVSYDELWNPQHYTIAREPRDWADSSNTSALYPLNTQGIGMGMAREGPRNPWTVGVDVNRIECFALSEDSSKATISGVRGSAAEIKAAGSTTISPIRHLETPVRTACRSPTDQPRAKLQIVDSEVTMRPQVNTMLLGSRLSGKSTVFKQMNLRWSGSLCDVEERERMRYMRGMGIKYQREESLQHAKTFKFVADKGFHKIMPLTGLIAMERLCADEAVQTALSQGIPDAFHDNLDYYLQNFDRYLSKTYIPSDDDILHCHFTTSETIEMSSTIGDLQYHVLDTGSRPRERDNAIEGFARASGFHCLIYTVPLLGFDQCPSFGYANRIQESLFRFASDCSQTNFIGATIILLFTNLDLFEAYIRRKLFKDHFPDYTGRQDDSIAARKFIAQKFLDVRNGMTIAEIFFINATDTKEVSAVLSRIEDLMKRRWRGENLQVAESDNK